MNAPLGAKYAQFERGLHDSSPDLKVKLKENLYLIQQERKIRVLATNRSLQIGANFT